MEVTIWALLVFMALGLFALAMVFVMNSVDEKIKAGNFPVAVLKASVVTALALVICVCPLLMPFTLLGLMPLRLRSRGLPCYRNA